VARRKVMNSHVKKMIAIALTAACICTFLSVSQCLAGAWTMQKGKLYNRLAFNYYFADDEFDRDGDRTDFALNGEFRDINLGNYIEYGLSNSVTLINSLYYKSIRKVDDSKKIKTYGIGDIDLGVRLKVSEGSWGILSTQTIVKIPEAYDKDKELPLGNGQYDVELRFLYGRSLWPHIPGYCNFEIGYRLRFDAPSDELRYLAEFGMDFSKNSYGRIKLDGIYSMDNGSHFDTSGNPTATNNFNLGKLDIALGYKITNSWGLEIGYTPEIYGKNTAAGATYTFAITYQIR
jgi:hypothetical protein